MNPRPARHAAALGKLASPRLGRVFDRTRLFELLDGWSDAPALWLAAPPGAGKTTLVATWLRQRDAPALWLQLDAADADPATFMQSLDALWGTLLDKSPQLPALRADDRADLAGWLRRRLAHMLPLLPPRWSLVLDNHQELPAQSPLQDALARVLADLPAGVQWVFVSREAPPPAFTSALARQQLAVIGAEALRFDDVETLALVRLHGRAESLAAGLAPAQGWAAGLTLMLLGASRDAGATAPEARERLFDYFAGEVLSRMPAEQQQALGTLAFLPSTTAELAVAMSGYAKAPQALEHLAASSLFTDRREGPPAVFVFHALFSEFLRRRVERSVVARRTARAVATRRPPAARRRRDRRRSATPDRSPGLGRGRQRAVALRAALRGRRPLAGAAPTHRRVAGGDGATPGLLARLVRARHDAGRRAR